MKRKDFIKTISLASLAAAFPTNIFGGRLFRDNFTFREIRNGAGFFYDRGGTIGWLNAPDALIAIDSQFPETVKIFYGELKKTAARKLDLLFNTHHHQDHTSGNPYLSQFTHTIVANKNCARLQKEKNSDGKTKIVAANVTFDSEWRLSLGKEKLFAYHLTRAHTGGDSIIHIENANVVHLGDLVFNRVYPWVNKSDEASLSGWIDFLEDAIKRFDSDTIFIFGHSFDAEHVTGGKEDLIYMRNYIQALIEYVSAQKKAGKSDEKIKAASFIPGFEKMIPLWNSALERNIEAALIELKERDEQTRN